jgi:hypothetical protein
MASRAKDSQPTTSIWQNPYIIINYVLRGNPVSGDKFDTKEPSHMLVDWVRAYELPDEEPLSLPTAPTSLVTHPGFDDGNEDTHTPSGWEDWSDIGSNPNGFTRQGNSYSGSHYYVMEADGTFRLFLSRLRFRISGVRVDHAASVSGLIRMAVTGSPSMTWSSLSNK